MALTLANTPIQGQACGMAQCNNLTGVPYHGPGQWGGAGWGYPVLVMARGRGGGGVSYPGPGWRQGVWDTLSWSWMDTPSPFPR